jgi:hypothetical protein
LDFASASPEEVRHVEYAASYTSQSVVMDRFAELIDGFGTRARKLMIVRYEFPWQRLFEAEVYFDRGVPQPAQPEPLNAGSPTPSGGHPIIPTLAGRGGA